MQLYTVESFFLPSLSLSFSLKHSGCQRNRALRANCIPLLSLCLSFHSFCFSLSPGSVSTAARLLHQNMNRHLSHTLLPTNLPPPLPTSQPLPPSTPTTPPPLLGPSILQYLLEKAFPVLRIFHSLANVCDVYVFSSSSSFSFCILFWAVLFYPHNKCPFKSATNSALLMTSF